MVRAGLAASRCAERGTFAVMVVVATVACTAACTRTEPAPDPVRAVRTMRVGGSAEADALQFAGEVRPRIESRLAFRVGGKVVQRHVELGSRVALGQPLAEIDPRDLKLGQDSARAALAAAQSSFDLAKADLARYRGLKDQGFISPAEFERHAASFDQARSALEQAHSQLSVQGNQAGYAVLVADAPGVVTGIDVEPGAVVSAGTPVFRVALDGPRDVQFSVPEDRLAAIRALGTQEAALQVRPWSDPTHLLPARVRDVSAAADAGTRTFLVKADIGDTPLSLGQTVTVLLHLGRSGRTLSVPLTAVREAEGRTAVWVLDGASMTVRLQPIDVAGSSGNSVAVASGLKPGDEVVTAGVHVLTPGEHVTRYVEPYAATPPPSAIPLARPPGVAGASQPASSASAGAGHVR